MSNQEFMPPEQYSGSRVLNTDPREQRQEYYEGSGMMQGGGEKIRSVQQRPRRRGLWILLAILLIIFLVGGGLSTVLAGSAFQSSTIAPPARSFTVTGTPKLHIEDPAGTIHIHRGQANTVVIQPTEHFSGFGSGPSRGDIKYSQDGDGNINVSARMSDVFTLSFRTIDLDITVPTQADLDVKSGSGSVNVKGVNGSVTAETGSGSITVNDINGQIDLHTGSGSITAQQVNGQAKLETGSGDINIVQDALSGDSFIKTGSGSERFVGSLDPHGNYQFQTGSGSIDVTLPASSSFQLDASTGSGSVNNDFGSDTVGSEPHASLSLHTGSGSINLHKSP